MQDSAHVRVGFIGLGAMGAPMAKHLHMQQLLAVVGNRTVSKARELAAELNVQVAEAAAMFSGCDVVMLCVGVDSDVLQNVNQLAAVLAPGAIVIDHSTVAVDTAVEAAAILARNGIHFIDAPVSGGVEGARNGRLSVMAGGEAIVLERARQALDCYAARISHMGPVGAGQATKAVNQVMVAGINEAVCEALALAERLGLQPYTLLPTLMAGAASNWFLEKRGASMLNNQFAPGFKCAHMAKDLGIVKTMAEQAGITHPVINQALADYQLLRQQGHGDADTSALILLKRSS